MQATAGVYKRPQSWGEAAARVQGLQLEKRSMNGVLSAGHFRPSRCTASTWHLFRRPIAINRKTCFNALVP
eukprot:scaffold167677_cov30-Tisochrysis_lutea.AAC.1